jgi:hypothetical protein
MAVAATAVAVLAAVSLNARTVIGAGGGGGCFATAGPICTFKSHVAFADFSAVQGVQVDAGGGGGGGGCIATDAFVQTFESLSMPGKSASTAVLVSLSTFDFCTGTQLECAGNFDPNTGAPLFDGQIQFGRDLTTASVTGTAPMFDPCTGGTFTSTINVTWQAFGPTTTLIDNSHQRSAGFLLNSHFKGISSEAVASGVLTDATGSNRASSPTVNADMEKDSSGTVLLNRS